MVVNELDGVVWGDGFLQRRKPETVYELLEMGCPCCGEKNAKHVSTKYWPHASTMHFFTCDSCFKDWAVVLRYSVESAELVMKGY